MAYSKKQETGGSCESSPGDKNFTSRAHKANPNRLDSNGGSHMRGTDNKKK